MKSKAAAYIALAGLSLAVSACGTTSGSGADSPSGDSPKAAKSLTIGIAGEGNNSSYGAAVDQGLKDEAARLGVTTYFTEAQYDGTKQASDVQDLIAKQPDGIALVAVDSGLASRLVDQIKQAGIPVAAIHTTVGTNFAPNYVYPGLTFLLGEDEIRTGYEDGQLAIKALPDGGKVAVVEGKAGYAAVIERLDGFKKAIAGHGFQIVASQPGDWDQAKAEAACQNMLQAKPDIDLFFAQEDHMAVGCADAVKKADSNAVVIGNGGAKTGIAGIKDGSLFGTVCTKPYTEGKLAMNKFVKALTGEIKLSKKRFNYPTPAITKENVSECNPEW